jgi:hypothetical protein
MDCSPIVGFQYFSGVAEELGLSNPLVMLVTIALPFDEVLRTRPAMGAVPGPLGTDDLLSFPKQVFDLVFFLVVDNERGRVNGGIAGTGDELLEE